MSENSYTISRPGKKIRKYIAVMESGDTFDFWSFYKSGSRSNLEDAKKAMRHHFGMHCNNAIKFVCLESKYWS